MGRAKLPLLRIADDKKRNRTFKKRKEGLKKKMHEFATLCGVKASMICFGPEGDRSEVTLWPEEPGRAEEIFREYRNRGVEEPGRRHSDLTSGLRERKKKAEEELLRLRQTNASLAYPPWDSSLLGQYSEDELRQLLNYLVKKIEMVENQMDERAKEAQIVESGYQTTESTLTGEVPQGEHGNEVYSGDTEKPPKLDYELEPMPISFMEPTPIDPQISFQSVLSDSTSVPNLLGCDYLNSNHDFWMLQQENSCYSSPAYGSFEREDFVLDMEMASFSGNSGFYPLMGDSSSNQMFSLPEFSAGMQHLTSAIQSPPIQLGDLHWQFAGGGGGIHRVELGN